MNDRTDQQAERVSDDMASRAGELHPRALLDPYVSLSAHTATDVRPPAYRRCQWANSVGLLRITRAASFAWIARNARPRSGGSRDLRLAPTISVPPRYALAVVYICNDPSGPSRRLFAACLAARAIGR